mgnify:FL=1
MDPSFRSFDASHLDTCQCVVQFLDNRAHLLHSAWEADFLAVIVDLSNWRDNSSSTAKTTLCEIFHFVEVDLTLLSFQSQVLFCNVDQGTTCDGWKDTVRLRCYNLAVFCNEDEVCSACLLNFCTIA